jgi:Tfp pilus assembly protein PilF
MDIIDRLESMLADGQDSAMLRFSLGSAYLKTGLYTTAIDHLLHALELDKNYSAAWKHYGKALEKNGQTDDAIAAYKSGIAIADKKGDIQAAKEMKVFLKRLEKE